MEHELPPPTTTGCFFFQRLPRSISASILGSWIDIEGLVSLDTACTNRVCREIYLHTISHRSLFVSGANDVVQLENSLLFTFWCRLRKLKLTNVLVEEIKVFGAPTQQYPLWNDSQYKSTARFEVSFILDDSGLQVAQILLEDHASFIQHIITLDSHSDHTSETELAFFIAQLQNMVHIIFRNETGQRINPSVSLFTACGGKLVSLTMPCWDCITDELLAHIARTCMQLQRIDISYCRNVGDDGVCALLGGCVQLSHIALRGLRQLSDISLFCLAKSRIDEPLFHLDLHECCSVTDKGINAAVSALGSNLKVLNLCHNCKVSGESFMHIAGFCHFIQYLDLSFCHKLDDPAAIGIIVACSDIRFVKFCNCFKVTDRTVLVLAERARSNSLLGINLSGCSITDDSVIMLAGAYPKLKFLDIGACTNLTDASIMAVAVCCGSALITLNMGDNNNISDMSFLKVAHCSRRLRSIDVSYCNQISDEAVTMALKMNPSLILRSMRRVQVKVPK